MSAYRPEGRNPVSGQRGGVAVGVNVGGGGAVGEDVGVTVGGAVGKITVSPDEAVVGVGEETGVSVGTGVGVPVGVDVDVSGATPPTSVGADVPTF